MSDIKKWRMRIICVGGYQSKILQDGRDTGEGEARHKIPKTPKTKEMKRNVM
jgi:hypothetical protein